MSEISADLGESSDKDHYRVRQFHIEFFRLSVEADSIVILYSGTPISYATSSSS